MWFPYEKPLKGGHQNPWAFIKYKENVEIGLQKRAFVCRCLIMRNNINCTTLV